MQLRPFMLAAAALAALWLVMDSARPADLKVTVSGIRSDAGSLMIGLYDSAGGFESAIAKAGEGGVLNDPGRLAGVVMRAKAGSLSIAFPQLPPGRYAVIVVHDENNNGKLDENVVGLPTEGFGFSNDARGLLSAPSFAAAAVGLGVEDRQVAVSLSYPLQVLSMDPADLEALSGKD